MSYDIKLPRDSVITHILHEGDQSDIEPMSDEKAKELIAAVNAMNKAHDTANSLTNDQIRAKCNLKDVPSEFKNSYVDLLFKHLALLKQIWAEQNIFFTKFIFKTMTLSTENNTKSPMHTMISFLKPSMNG